MLCYAQHTFIHVIIILRVKKNSDHAHHVIHHIYENRKHVQYHMIRTISELFHVSNS